MKKIKGFLTLAMALLMVAGMIPMGTLAADEAKSEIEVYADVLNALGIFKGTNDGYELENIPNRVQASVMLVRLLGKEEAALDCTEEHPFTDVPEWAQGYVSYMYANGLTQGMSDILFGSDTVCDGKMYVTFVLRALAFNDAEGDFSYDTAITFGRMQGLLTGEDALRYAESGFTRGDMALMSYNALFAECNSSEDILLQKLYDEGAVEQMTAKKILNTIEAEDLIAWATYNTILLSGQFDYTEKLQTELSVPGYPAQSLSIDIQGRAIDLYSNPMLAFLYTYHLPNGMTLNREQYIVDSYIYIKDFDGSKTKNILTNDEEDTFEDEDDSIVSILDTYLDVSITEAADGTKTITITNDPTSAEARKAAKEFVGQWVDLASMKETQYVITCTKYVTTYVINADMEVVSDSTLIEATYFEDGDPDLYTITGTDKTTYHAVDETLTIELPDDLDEYQED